MTAPVINALADKLPAFRLTLQSNHPPDFLASRYRHSFERISGDDDFGLVMDTATVVRVEDSAEAYRRLHDRLAVVVDAQARRMRALSVDLVLSNIGYIPLLAAKRAGIPSIALSCLNWADIYHRYLGHRPEARAIEADMLAGYRSARVVLATTPAMPMERLSNVRPIGPVAAIAGTGRGQVRRQLGLGEETRLGLITFGGMDSGVSLANWPKLAGWTWLVAGDPRGRPDMIAYDRRRADFTDALAASDVVITKPGYGTFAEAALNGVPVLFAPRPDWPECPNLDDWLIAHGRARSVPTADLMSPGILTEQLQMLFSSPPRPLPRPTGVEEAAGVLFEALRGTGRMHK